MKHDLDDSLMESEMMQAIVFDTPGEPEVLRLTEIDRPSAGPGEVLIKVSAFGINKPDIMQRRGLYPPPVGASPLLGLEIAGSISELGEGVSNFSIDDVVCALTHGGGYAEYVVVDANHCLPVPDGLTEIDAAGLPETYFTVWSNFFLDQAPQPGSHFLVHGGAGGIGSTAIQLGHAFGLRVFTTCHGEMAARFCRKLGADFTIDYRNEDFVEVMQKHGGADLVLDMIGGPYLQRNMKLANPDARIVQLAFNQGSKVELDLLPIMMKRLHLTGSTLRARPSEFKTRIATSLRENVWPLFADGRLQTVTHKVGDPDEIADIHRQMEQGGHLGKFIVSWPR